MSLRMKVNDVFEENPEHGERRERILPVASIDFDDFHTWLTPTSFNMHTFTLRILIELELNYRIRLHLSFCSSFEIYQTISTNFVYRLQYLFVLREPKFDICWFGAILVSYSFAPSKAQMLNKREN